MQYNVNLCRGILLVLSIVIYTITCYVLKSDDSTKTQSASAVVVPDYSVTAVDE